MVRPQSIKAALKAFIKVSFWFFLIKGLLWLLVLYAISQGLINYT